jgi:ribosomal protein S17E
MVEKYRNKETDKFDSNNKTWSSLYKILKKLINLTAVIKSKVACAKY